MNSLASVVCGSRVSIDWRNVKIFHPEQISIGNNFSCGHSLWLESVEGHGRISIGDNVNFSDMVHVGCVNSVSIGDGVLVGSKVLITDHSHGKTAEVLGSEFPNSRKIHSAGPVRIERAVWLGDNVCILPAVTVGASAIVGSNSVVTSDIPSATVWAGSPARQIWPQVAPLISAQDGSITSPS